MDGLDIDRFIHGQHAALHEHLGALVARDRPGVWFSVWAPGASAVRVVGDFNRWDSTGSQLARREPSGVWEHYEPAANEGHRYQFEITTAEGEVTYKADPLALQAEIPPGTASVVHRPGHVWQDQAWMAARSGRDHLNRPMSVYEVHLGSWRRDLGDDGSEPTYGALAEALAAYVIEMGFTHVELMPVMAHPFGGSWGYQVSSYFAPSPRWGTPDDFAAFVDHLHRAGIGVVIDWVPGHFPRDDWALARFDGTPLYEHRDPRRSAHPDWGTLLFDYGRPEVRNFLLSNARFWVERYHVDGIRVDAVASMLYLDYSRAPGEWLPNRHGGREDLEAVDLLRQLNDDLHASGSGAMAMAEESTTWPGVTHPTADGGLGFAMKWNLGWMHDTLAYFAETPVNRRHHHHRLTFSIDYAFSENFLLPLSHDEVVHGKGSLLARMPGDRRERLANLRALYGLMWSHPGKQLLFMGGELAQEREWDHDGAIDWQLLDDPGHAGVQHLVRDLNHRYRDHPALWAADFDPHGFTWLAADDAGLGVFAFLRHDPARGAVLACVANLSGTAQRSYRLGLPVDGTWRVVLDTDDPGYGGSGAAAVGRSSVTAADGAWQGQPRSVTIDLPPLTVLWLEPDVPR